MAKILVVDDEVKMVTLLKSALVVRGHEVQGVHGGKEALDLVSAEEFDVVLTDLRMEPVDGMAVVKGIKETSPDTEVIILTAFGDVDSAVSAMQAGACHYMTKPINFQNVAAMVEKFARAGELSRENRSLKLAVAVNNAGQEMVGQAQATEKLKDLIGRVAPSDATVLIRGESGVGKEVCARSVHNASKRAEGPFVAVNCAAIAETLLESELFGYRKGAFTGADTDRDGLFEAARGGTLFLDEIGEAPLAVQAKLLRVLEEKKINRVGDPRETDVDARIIAATNRPLEDSIAEKSFREDLYFRLLVFPLDVPPLRDRTDDVAPLVTHFMSSLGRKQKKLPAKTLARLRAYGWPGNIRELRNLIERAHILAGLQEITDEHIQLNVSPGTAKTLTEFDLTGDLSLDNHMRMLIETALDRAGGNKSQAAQMLGITRRTLYSRLKLLGMQDDSEE
ncbi:MAG: sigma-54-dependent Fis family transcriptional regulator [bacterium]|nr:sigma-54-dependent Fis family transcriptional regulator [bacterium]